MSTIITVSRGFFFDETIENKKTFSFKCRKHGNESVKKKSQESFDKFCLMFPELTNDNFNPEFDKAKKKYLAENAEDLKNEAAVERYLDTLEMREASKAARNRKDSETDFKRFKAESRDAS